MGKLKDWLIDKMQNDEEFRYQAELDELARFEPGFAPEVSGQSQPPLAEDWQEAA
jgi:hypothetical protein